MVSEQDDEDSKLQWRVEQEVGAAVSAQQAAEAQAQAMESRLGAAEKQVNRIGECSILITLIKLVSVSPGGRDD